MAIQQPGLSQEVRAIPEAAKHRTRRVGVTQLRPQLRLAVEADTEPATDDQYVLVPLVQFGQRAVGRDGDSQVARDQLVFAADDQDLEHRCRTHEVGRHQGIHRAGEGHHREMLAQDEGDTPYRRRQSCTAGPVQVGQVLAPQYTLE
ncbi:hypothetical protein FQZ97_361850 [compost metagenome]